MISSPRCWRTARKPYEAYFFFFGGGAAPADCLSLMDFCFALLEASVLPCFCLLSLFFDFGDLSPMVVLVCLNDSDQGEPGVKSADIRWVVNH